MARLSDVPHVFRTVGPWTFAKRVYKQISEDLVFTWGAALAYSWLFAIFPFLIFLLTLAPYLPYNTKENVMQEVNQAIARFVPGEGAQTLLQNIENVMNEPRGGLLSLGLIVAIWVASSGMAVTMQAMDITYDIKKRRNYVMQRIVAIGLTIAAAILILAVLVLLPIGTLIINWIVSQAEVLNAPLLILLNVSRYALALVLLFALVAMIYYFGPSLRTKFHVITPGAAFVVTVWLLLAFGFRIYVNQFGRYDQMYGTVGGVAIILLLFYLDAVVLLAGAEINSEVDFIVMGIPSSPDEAPEEAAANAAPLDEEQEALAEELQSKRREDLAAPIVGSPPGERSAPPSRRSPTAGEAAPSASSSRWLVVLSTLGLVLLVDKLRPRRSRPAAISEPQRLKQTYPVTYAALSSKDGSDDPREEAP